MTAPSRPRAFVVTSATRLDLKDAVRYGELTFLFDSGSSISPLEGNDYMAAVQERLDAVGFDPTIDFFVLAGPVLQVSLALAALMSLDAPLKVLMFDARESKYIARRLDVMRRVA